MPARPIDRPAFVARFPSGALYGKELNPSRRQGFEAIFDIWDEIGAGAPLAGLAYALGTAWHETGGRMQPVREGFAASDAAAYKTVTEYCAKKGIGNYAARHANGRSYYGRGYVQLTHGANYQKMGKALGVGSAWYDSPDEVLAAAIGGRILLVGMASGLFRPAAGKLADYFGGGSPRWYDARALINGDKATLAKWAKKDMGTLVADYGKGFAGALSYT